MKTVLITGAGARVGAHLAKGLAEQGWAVAIHYNRSRDGARALAADIKSGGGTAHERFGRAREAVQGWEKEEVVDEMKTRTCLDVYLLLPISSTY